VEVYCTAAKRTRRVGANSGALSQVGAVHGPGNDVKDDHELTSPIISLRDIRKPRSGRVLLLSHHGTA